MQVCTYWKWRLLVFREVFSIPTDNAKRAIQGNEAMQVMQTGDQWKFATNGSGASWWQNLQPIQMVPSDDDI